jgi:hypothetical protein
MDRQARIDQLKSIQIKMGKPRAQRRPAVGGKWSYEEDERLKAIVEENGARNWKKVRISSSCELKARVRLPNYSETRGQKSNACTDGIKS